MRILILYARFGMGHLSAAHALREAFINLEVTDVRTADTLDFVSPLVSRSLTRAYEWQTEQAPGLWRRLYEGSDVETMESALSGNRLLGLLGLPFLVKLLRAVDEARPDGIVCVHPLPAQVLTALYRQRGHSGASSGGTSSNGTGGTSSQLPPIYVVATDYFVHSQWLTPGVAGYFVASALTRDLLLERGVPPELLHVTGIPIRAEIATAKPKAEMRHRHRLPPDGPVITLCGGGIDGEHVRAMVGRLLTRGPSPEPPHPGQAGELIVVCGRNRRLPRDLRGVQPGAWAGVRVLGQIDYLDDLIAASDLVISKAGGLMVSEVLARATPLLIVEPIPGQEEWNADYVTAVGAGIQLRQAEMVAPAVRMLLSEPDLLDSMRTRALRVAQPHAANAIAAQIKDHVEGRSRGSLKPRELSDNGTTFGSLGPGHKSR